MYQFAYTVDPGNNVIQTNVTDPLNIVRHVTFDSFGKLATDTHAAGCAGHSYWG